MRPKKTRMVKCYPGQRRFNPQCGSSAPEDEIHLTLDEFEAIRLSSVEGLKQEQAAKMMRISRPTFSRIITSAHQKIGDALVNIRSISIEGGCCEVIEKKARNNKKNISKYHF